MFLKRKRTIWERLLICSIIALHINLVLPMSDILPLPKKIKDIVVPKAHADEPNQPPVLDPIGNKVVDEGKSLEFQVSASDPEGDTLVYSASNLPTGAMLNPATRVFNWTPSYQQAGTYENVHFEAEEVDTATKLLLHCNAETGFSDSSFYGHPVTNYGHAFIDTSAKKLGTASLSLDDAGDYLAIPYSDDWNFGSSDFTIDCWVKFKALPADGAYMMFYSQGNPNNAFFGIHNVSGVYKLITYFSGAVYMDDAITVTANRWYHFATIRNGTVFKQFQDGVQTATTYVSTGSTPNDNVALYIGCAKGTSHFLDGWID